MGSSDVANVTAGSIRGFPMRLLPLLVIGIMLAFAGIILGICHCCIRRRRNQEPQAELNAVQMVFEEMKRKQKKAPKGYKYPAGYNIIPVTRPYPIFIQRKDRPQSGPESSLDTNKSMRQEGRDLTQSTF